MSSKSLGRFRNMGHWDRHDFFPGLMECELATSEPGDDRGV